MSKREEKNKPKGKEDSKDSKDKKDKKDKKDDDKNKEQIKLRVFEEDDYFEEFEEGI